MARLSQSTVALYQKILRPANFLDIKKVHLQVLCKIKSVSLKQLTAGTLFLDEIGNLGYDVQIKLLRALQERIVVPIGSTNPVKVDVRL